MTGDQRKRWDRIFNHMSKNLNESIVRDMDSLLSSDENVYITRTTRLPVGPKLRSYINGEISYEEILETVNIRYFNHIL